MFRHPKYYKELRKRNKEEARAQLKVPSSNLDQAISSESGTPPNERATGPGLRSYPLSGNGGKLDSLQTLADKAKAPSLKQQAASTKQQASSTKLIKQQAASIKPRG